MHTNNSKKGQKENSIVTGIDGQFAPASGTFLCVDELFSAFRLLSSFRTLILFATLLSVKVDIILCSW